MSEPEAEKPTANEEAKEPPSASTGEPAEEEEDLKKLEAEIAKMEEEAARIARETEDLERAKESKQPSTASATGGGAKGASGDAAAATKRDGLSIYVGQVDYNATPEELLAHFEACGTVERVTIVCDKYTGMPKGYAYLEFTTEEAVENATKLDGSVFKERKLKVTHKRVNDPNYYATAAGPGGGPGRGGRGPPGGGGPGGGAPYYRGGGGGYRGGGRMYRGGFRGRGPGRGFRGGGRGGGGYHGGYHPYY